MPDQTWREGSAAFKETLFAIVGTVPYGILNLDLQGDCTLANEQAAELLGRPLNSLIEAPFSAVFSGIEPLQAIEAGHRIPSGDFREISIPPRTITLRIRRHSSGHLVSLEDVTEAVADHRNLQETLGNLQSANTQLQQFAQASTHDLRSPLTSIIGLLERIKVAEASPDQRMMDMAMSSALQMRQTLDVLHHSLELQQQLSHAQPQDTPIQRALDEVLENLDTPLPDTARVSVDLSQAPVLPIPHTLLRQLLQNLTSNAIRFADARRPLALDIRSEQDSTRIRLDITDNGTGAELAARGQRLFGLFSRFHPGISGLGTGLHDSRAIVAGFGGQLTARAVSPHGLTFSIELPL